MRKFRAKPDSEVRKPELYTQDYETLFLQNDFLNKIFGEDLGGKVPWRAPYLLLILAHQLFEALGDPCPIGKGDDTDHANDKCVARRAKVCEGTTAKQRASVADSPRQSNRSWALKECPIEAR